MNREDYIKQLTEHELRYLVYNHEEEYILKQIVDFFVDGGYNSYSDEQLQKSYQLLIAEENV